jgi:hypothetical protein
MQSQAIFAEHVLDGWVEDGDDEAARWIYDEEAEFWRSNNGTSWSRGYYQLGSQIWSCLHKYTIQRRVQFANGGLRVHNWSEADQATVTVEVRRWSEILDSSYDGEGPPSDLLSTGVYVATLEDGLVTSYTGGGASEGYMVKYLARKNTLLRISSEWDLTIDFSSLKCPGQELTGTFRIHDEENAVLDTWTGARSTDVDQEESNGLFASELSQTSYRVHGLRFCGVNNEGNDALSASSRGLEVTADPPLDR